MYLTLSPSISVFVGFNTIFTSEESVDGNTMINPLRQEKALALAVMANEDPQLYFVVSDPATGPKGFELLLELAILV